MTRNVLYISSLTSQVHNLLSIAAVQKFQKMISETAGGMHSWVHSEQGVNSGPYYKPNIS